MKSGSTTGSSVPINIEPTPNTEWQGARPKTSRPSATVLMAARARTNERSGVFSIAHSSGSPDQSANSRKHSTEQSISMERPTTVSYDQETISETALTGTGSHCEKQKIESEISETLRNLDSALEQSQYWLNLLASAKGTRKYEGKSLEYLMNKIDKSELELDRRKTKTSSLNEDLPEFRNRASHLKDEISEKKRQAAQLKDQLFVETTLKKVANFAAKTMRKYGDANNAAQQSFTEGYFGFADKCAADAEAARSNKRSLKEELRADRTDFRKSTKQANSLQRRVERNEKKTDRAQKKLDQRTAFAAIRNFERNNGKHLEPIDAVRNEANKIFEQYRSLGAKLEEFRNGKLELGPASLQANEARRDAENVLSEWQRVVSGFLAEPVTANSSELPSVHKAGADSLQQRQHFDLDLLKGEWRQPGKTGKHLDQYRLQVGQQEPCGIGSRDSNTSDNLSYPVNGETLSEALIPLTTANNEELRQKLIDKGRDDFLHRVDLAEDRRNKLDELRARHYYYGVNEFVKPDAGTASKMMGEGARGALRPGVEAPPVGTPQGRANAARMHVQQSKATFDDLARQYEDAISVKISLAYAVEQTAKKATPHEVNASSKLYKKLQKADHGREKAAKAFAEARQKYAGTTSRKKQDTLSKYEEAYRKSKDAYDRVFKEVKAKYNEAARETEYSRAVRNHFASEQEISDIRRNMNAAREAYDVARISLADTEREILAEKKMDARQETSRQAAPAQYRNVHQRSAHHNVNLDELLEVSSSDEDDIAKPESWIASSNKDDRADIYDAISRLTQQQLSDNLNHEMKQAVNYHQNYSVPSGDYGSSWASTDASAPSVAAQPEIPSTGVVPSSANVAAPGAPIQASISVAAVPNVPAAHNAPREWRPEDRYGPAVPVMPIQD